MLRIFILILSYFSMMISSHAQTIERRADFLAAFVLFGADYRNTGPDRTLTGSHWIVKNRDPLTFYRQAEDETMVIRTVNRCQYTVETETKSPLNGSPTKRLTEIDFNALRRVGLYDSGLGTWVLRGDGGSFWCNIKTTPSGVRMANCKRPFDNGTGEIVDVWEDLGGGADPRAIVSAYTTFFNNVCPRPQHNYAKR
ncbi:hypothetical protein ASD54_25360 [Rhizobium sp. Root149]|uniref:hypothetical protein n=1 Tax=Rhizobium sp. Root149 TaxID=1736473 RepID=UPI0007146233|nr:hypothetical protein [Rhizobium sp. Root149]KQZ56273.1 hypothetical protein ASD54_25360 [Rhizobium sp. Root149]